MPERVTKEERMVSLAIEKARLAKEELSAKKRMNIEPTQVKEVDTSVEEVKIKRPKVQDASKITNQTQKKEGYGLAGESLKKQDKTEMGDERQLSLVKKRFRRMKTKIRELSQEVKFLTQHLEAYQDSLKVSNLDVNVNVSQVKARRRLAIDMLKEIEKIYVLLTRDEDGIEDLAQGIEFSLN